MQRPDGYYICEVDYDFERAILWWDSKKQKFLSPGVKEEIEPEFFSFISPEQIPLYEAKNLMKVEEWLKQEATQSSD